MKSEARRGSKAVVLGWWVVACMLLPPIVAMAGNEAPDRKQQRVMSTRTFLNAHPDLKHRNEGWVAFQAGDHAAAMKHFHAASRYADKPSQAMIAEMHWQGLGVPVDKAMGYAWADLAAERGYVQFIRLREQYWRALDEAQRERAVSEGSLLLSEHADSVARPRMAAFMKKAKQRARRTAPYASMPKEVHVPGPDGGQVRIQSGTFYDPKFWDPVKYQQWQDALWTNPPAGKVDVGDVQQVPPRSE